MWTLTFQEVTVRSDELTLDEIAAIEKAADVDWRRLDTGVTSHLRALVEGLLAHAGFDPDMAGQVKRRDVTVSTDDLPDYYVDGMPEGGRYEDVWVAQLCRPPFGFTPRQVRNEFTVRDLHLIAAAGSR